jgi:hypothetical protein
MIEVSISVEGQTGLTWPLYLRDAHYLLTARPAFSLGPVSSSAGPGYSGPLS